MIGPGATGTVLALGFGSARGVGSIGTVLPVLLVAALATVTMVATARWLTAVLSDLLRRRRSQEVVALVLGVFLAIPGLVSAALVEGEGDLGVDGSGVIRARAAASTESDRAPGPASARGSRDHRHYSAVLSTGVAVYAPLRIFQSPSIFIRMK